MRACPATCADIDGPNDCVKPCTEGCECDEGWVLSGQTCVPVEQCGCYRDERYFMVCIVDSFMPNFDTIKVKFLY